MDVSEPMPGGRRPPEHQPDARLPGDGGPGARAGLPVIRVRHSSCRPGCYDGEGGRQMARIYRGIIKDGIVVFPDGMNLPDGTEVEVHAPSVADDWPDPPKP